MRRIAFGKRILAFPLRQTATYATARSPPRSTIRPRLHRDAGSNTSLATLRGDSSKQKPPTSGWLIGIEAYRQRGSASTQGRSRPIRLRGCPSSVRWRALFHPRPGGARRLRRVRHLRPATGRRRPVASVRGGSADRGSGARRRGSSHASAGRQLRDFAELRGQPTAGRPARVRGEAPGKPVDRHLVQRGVQRRPPIPPSARNPPSNPVPP